MKNKVDFNKLKKADNKPDIEAAVKMIHQEQPIDKEKITRVSLDMPESMHKNIKRKMLDRDIKTIREYFLKLAQRDLTQ